MTDITGITFRAYFSKATTLIDGGWRISFDLDERSGVTTAQVAAMKGQELQIGVVPFDLLADPIEQDPTHG